jgi:hypothetical protein
LATERGPSERPARRRAQRAGAERSSEGRPARREPASSGSENGFFPDLVRRGLTLGFTGLFLTEEALRRALGDSLPRDWIEFVIGQSERTRAEFLDRLSREFARALTAVDPAEIARRLLEGRSIEVTARLRLVPRDEEPDSGRRR